MIDHNDETFLSSIKRLMIFSRAVGLAPITIEKDHTGKYYVKTSRKAQIYSYGVVITAYALISYAGQQLFENESVAPDDPKLGYLYDERWWYMHSRAIITAFIPIYCWMDLPLIVTSLTRIEALGVIVTPSKHWEKIPILLVIFPMTDSALWATYGVEKIIFVEVFSSALVEMLPVLMVAFVCVHFMCQVNIMNIAMTSFNKELPFYLERLKDGSSATLRPIMIRQQILWKTYQCLNAAYGRIFLIVSTSAFLEGSVAVIIYNQFRPLNEMVFGLVFAFFCILPLGIVMHICQITEDQLRETKGMCSELKITTQLNLISNTEVCEWEVQLKHHRIEYNACECFSLNGRQFMSMVCTIISYYFCYNWLFESKSPHD